MYIFTHFFFNNRFFSIDKIVILLWTKIKCFEIISPGEKFIQFTFVIVKLFNYRCNQSNKFGVHCSCTNYSVREKTRVKKSRWIYPTGSRKFIRLPLINIPLYIVESVLSPTKLIVMGHWLFVARQQKITRVSSVAVPITMALVATTHLLH